MNMKETALILTALRNAYPHSYRDLGPRDFEQMIELWQSMFEDDSYAEVSAAVKALITSRTVGYSPVIGEVKEKLHALRHVGELSEQDAWAMVSKACANGLYGYQKEFDKLPPEVQRAVGSPEQIKAWAAMDVETVESVVASNFMRNYRTQAARKKEFDMLPESVRTVIGPLADSLKLIGGAG